MINRTRLLFSSVIGVLLGALATYYLKAAGIADVPLTATVASFSCLGPQAIVVFRSRWALLILLGLFVVGVVAAKYYEDVASHRSDFYLTLLLIIAGCATTTIYAGDFVMSRISRRMRFQKQFGLSWFLLAAATLGGTLGITGIAFRSGEPLRELDAIVLYDGNGPWSVSFATPQRITDENVKMLSNYPSLKSINLHCTRVTDAGVVHLSDLPRLEWLNLSDTSVSDAGLANLEGLFTLRFLSLVSTDVTPEGVDDLRRQLPECDIRY